MEALFLKLVNMSITASWLVLAIIAVRLIFKKAPKWILCLLWALVAFRLVCPFSIESSLSLIPDIEPLAEETTYTSETVKQAHGEILDSEGNVIVKQNPAANGNILDSEGNVIVEIQDGIRTYPEKEQTHSWMYFLSRIWLVGFGLMLTYAAVSYYLLKRKVTTAIPLKRGIKQSEYVDSPFVLGIIRPVIYLPFGMPEGDMAYVIAHEKAHIRRRDHWWKPFGFGLLSIYWFNPVLWLAYILLCRDIEAACDEKVIKDMEKDERRAYSTALLNCSIHRRRIAACPLAFGETGVKARVRSVMNYKKPAFWVILIALAVSIIVAVCFLTNPKSEEEDSSGYELVERVISQNGYTILDQENTKINLVIEKEKLPEACFTLKGHTFEPKEVIPHQTFADNKLYLKHVGIDEERSEYLRFTFAFQTDSLELETLLLPYHVDVPGNGFICNVEVNRGEVWDNQNTFENAAYFEPVMNGEGFCVLVKKAICETAGHHIAFMLNDMNRLTYEVREEISPVTISLENVRPTGVTILFHQNQDLIDGPLICGHEFFLQQQVEGTWIPLPEIGEAPFRDQTYDIAELHHHGVDWEQLYGTLPTGSYRLGKKIPITSGENPEYTTVYAEFSIGKVYTWFDDFSSITDEHSPKDNVVDIFGMEGVSLSYRPADNAIHIISAEGNSPIISTDLLIRSIFLTDLTGDGVSEVCATVHTTNGMHIEVYDAAEKRLFELPNPENNFYVLTKKADRLCVVQNSANWIAQDYGQLSLTEKGLEIRELDPAVQALTEKVVCVDVDNRKHACISLPDQLERVLGLLRDLENNTQPASKEKLAVAQADPFDHVHLTVNYELGEKVVVFSESFDLVWEYGSQDGFAVTDPEPIRRFVESATDGVRDKETSGEPFATVDTPWDWAANVHSNAVSTAEMYVCLAVSSYGNTTSVSSNNGILPADTLQRLITVLNQIPKDSFADSGMTQTDYRWFYHEQTEGNCTVTFIDGVNQLGVAIRLCKDNIEMILTEELDKAQEFSYEYLSTPAKVWTIRNSELRAFLEDIRENPPVINYSVGAEYDWQDPMEFAKDGFTLNLRLIEGWEFERVAGSDNSGIRCRPEGITDGWIYFSFWPKGYTVQENDRYYSEGQTKGFPSKTSFPASVQSPEGFDTRNAIWSYEAIYTDIGDVVILNDGADSWFLEYKDQISDMITYMTFSVD